MDNTGYASPYIARISKFCAGKWNLQVLWELRVHKKMRYNEMRDTFEGISPSTLSSVLSTLQKQGLVKRTKYGKSPPYKVEYQITQNGIELIVASSALVKWAMKN
ncbi:MAG: winged helix-turn-helix transcriptional regulator [Candidatus Nitrosotenuis sp.]